ncbi:MAG: dinitrogenase iron-molybdenum cofactor biosynthesis protein [Planctomycetes bacterium]|nr:dinitrogenase iron-molybdenum cofactor biosynthesis protein [Planctomycetota bacterium]
MKIALPTDGTRVDSHFGHCSAFTIFTVGDNGQIVSETTFTPPPGCGCKSNVVPELAAMGVSVMLAGNMGGGAVNILTSHGIQVVRGCEGEVRDVAEAWLAHKLRDSGTSCHAHGGQDCTGS